MSTLHSGMVLNALIQHETLTIEDISKKEILGLLPNDHHLQALLTELKKNRLIDILNDVVPVTYTVTQKGIDEGLRLARAGQTV